MGRTEPAVSRSCGTDTDDSGLVLDVPGRAQHHPASPKAAQSGLVLEVGAVTDTTGSSN